MTLIRATEERISGATFLLNKPSSTTGLVTCGSVRSCVGTPGPQEHLSTLWLCWPHPGRRSCAPLVRWYAWSHPALSLESKNIATLHFTLLLTISFQQCSDWSEKSFLVVNDDPESPQASVYHLLSLLQTKSFLWKHILPHGLADIQSR